MHVITYSPNFAHPHFPARGIPKNTPTAQWKVILLAFICCPFTPYGWTFFFSLSLYTNDTLLHGLILFVKYGKG